MLISQLPEGIRKIAEERREDAHPGHDEDDLKGAFLWSVTPEGFEIWFEANRGNFAPFYEFHKIKK